MFGQQGGLHNQLNLAKGYYSTEYIFQQIEEQSNHKVSHASNTSLPDSIWLRRTNPVIQEVLYQIFDADKYSFQIRKSKILIIPVSQNQKLQELTISGYVEDQSSGERIIGANIYIPGTSLATTSNAYGFYSFNVPFTDSLLIVCNLYGYNNSYLNPAKKAVVEHIFYLKLTDKELDEVVVVADDGEALNTQMSNVKLKTEDIKEMPAFFGEVDLLKAVQFLPGVQTGSEGNINYIVRGGNPDQNLILLDGVPVYNASHIFGFFSVFNADAIKHVELTKGAFPARVGGRLSSVLEVGMKEGDMKSYHGSGAIGILSSKLTLEGPIIKDKASFMISGRRTYSDLIYRPFLKKGQDAGYYFADLNTKLNYKFSNKDRIYISFYNGLDKGFNKPPDNTLEFEGHLKWGNYTGAARWNHLFSKKMFGNLALSYSRFNFEIASTFQNDSNVNALKYFSRIIDHGLRYDIDYILSPQHSFKTGISYTHHNFKPGAISVNVSQQNVADLDSLLQLSDSYLTHDIFLYGEDNWTINDKWKANLGLHYSIYFVNQKFYNSLQPRTSIRYLLSNDWALKTSYSYMQQYIHLLTNSSIGLPTDIWVTSTDNIRPQISHQFALGTNYYWNSKIWELNSEVYYKKQSGLIAYKPTASFAPAANWEKQILSGGNGEAYGWEIFLRHNGKKNKGWIAYSLAKSERQFEELNNGKTFPFKYDRRHDFKIVMSHNFTKKFSAGFTWIYTSGIKATIPISTYRDLNGNIITRFSDRNAFTYPDYHRLDVNFNWNKKTSWGERNWGVSIFNAYNRRNPFFIYFSTTPTGRTATQVSIFQILPSFHYNFKF